MSTEAIQHPGPNPSYASPPVTIILTIILLVFFFAGFFSIYFCRCFMDHIATRFHLQRNPSNRRPSRQATANVNPGLDPSIIETFPKFEYSTVKDYRKENSELECAICLSEFEDQDLLRLLTVCCHVFHQDCIDLWLESHKTCPVCRRSLDAPESDLTRKSCPLLCNDLNHDHIQLPEHDHENDSSGGGGSIMENSVVITINKDDDGNEQAVVPTSRHDDRHDDRDENNNNNNNNERFPRSHSTGHSFVRTISGEGDGGGNDDDNHERYTLRLPEHVHSRIVKGHHWAKSCTAFGNYSQSNNNVKDQKNGNKNSSSTGGGGGGEVSGFSGDNDDKV